MESDLEMDLLTIRTETGETLEIFSVPHRLKEDTSHKINHTPNPEVINLTIQPSAHITINIRLVLRLRNKNFNKTITRRHLLWFV